MASDAGEEEGIWARKLDGAAIDKENKILYVLEFKRTTDQKEEYEEGARVRAEKQYEDLVQDLLRVGRKQGQRWTAKQITFVGGTCRSVNVTILIFQKNPFLPSLKREYTAVLQSLNKC